MEIEKKIINKLKKEQFNMETNKEVTIAVRVDKKIADQLKRRAKQKELIFSSYVRRILVNETKKENKECQ